MTMKFADMVPLIRDLTVKREKKNVAESQLTMAKARKIAMKPEEAQAELDSATAEWWEAWQTTEKAWDEILTPLGLTRQDLRMAAI
jgi:hypothetical protein